MLQEDPTLHVVDAAPAFGELEVSLSQVDVLVIAGDGGLLPAISGELPADRRPADQRPGTQPGDLPALLVLTSEPRAAREFSRLLWRAWGLLAPDATPEELHAAVSALHQGLLVGAPELLSPLLSPSASANLLSSPGDRLPGEALTGRELDVLHCLAQGLANKQISQALSISEHTVKFHVSAIYAKLGVTNRTEAVRAGIQRGLVIV